jgi:hypothetical protein
MRTTGGEEFLLSPNRGDPEKGVHDVGIGDQDASERDHTCDGSISENHEVESMDV